jgi:hypothetical protein
MVAGFAEITEMEEFLGCGGLQPSELFSLAIPLSDGATRRLAGICCYSAAGIGFTTTYNNAVTAKIPVSRTKLQDLWVRLWVEKFEPKTLPGNDSNLRF